MKTNLACTIALLTGMSAPVALADVIDIDVLGHSFQVVSAVPGQGTNACTISVGDTVTWTWRSPLHSVSADNGSFDSGLQNPPFVFSHTFASVGTYGYYCVIHGMPGFGMFGTIRVVAPCYPNCDASSGSPLLTANDFQCFLNRYAAGDSYANCDASTGTPTLTANDFQCFLNSYAGGCS